MQPASASRPQTRPTLLEHTTDRLLLFYLILVLVATTAVLIPYWNDEYEKPIRQWLIVNAVLTTMRTSGRIAMHIFPADRWHLLRRLLAWIFRLLTLVSIAWFITGIRFLTQERVKGPVYKLASAIIGFELCVLGISIVLGVVIFLFALHPVLTGRHGQPAATEEDLKKLRVFRFEVEGGGDTTGGKEVSNETEVSCSICLCDYQKDELLRELPCKVGRHVFHADCIDEWLTQKLSCPICRDDPLAELRDPGEQRV